MKYALAVIAMLAASFAAYAGGNPFIAGFAQGFMQAQPSYPYPPQHALQYNSIPPIPSIPPVGSSSCHPIRICDVTGTQCVWQQVCR